MNHYIITRLNADLWFNSKKYGKFYNNKTECSMNYACDLFELSCYQSVINQLDQNFKWIIITSPNLPDKIKSRMLKYERCDFLLPITQHEDSLKYKHCDYKGFVDPIQKWLINNNITGTLITTLLDSDDMLPKDYISYVNNNYKIIKHPGIFKTTELIIVDGLSVKKVKKPIEIIPPHISLIETPVDGLYRTCLFSGHRRWLDNGDYVKEIIDSGRLVCMTNNNLNVGTKFNGEFSNVKKYKLKKIYGIDINKLQLFLQK